MWQLGATFTSQQFTAQWYSYISVGEAGVLGRISNNQVNGKGSLLNHCYFSVK